MGKKDIWKIIYCIVLFLNHPFFEIMTTVVDTERLQIFLTKFLSIS